MNIEKPDIKSAIAKKAFSTSGIKIYRSVLKTNPVKTARVTSLAMIYSVK
jgi:hypothetical protein